MAAGAPRRKLCVRPCSPLEWGGAGGGRGGRDPRARGAWSTRARSRFAGDSFRTRAAPLGRAIARDRGGASRWRRGILGRVCHAVWGERTLRASSRRSATSPSLAKVLTERTDLTGCARDWGGGVSVRLGARARRRRSARRRADPSRDGSWLAESQSPSVGSRTHLGDGGGARGDLAGGDARDGRGDAESGHGDGGHFRGK